MSGMAQSISLAPDEPAPRQPTEGEMLDWLGQQYRVSISTYEGITALQWASSPNGPALVAVRRSLPDAIRAAMKGQQ